MLKVKSRVTLPSGKEIEISPIVNSDIEDIYSVLEEIMDAPEESGICFFEAVYIYLTSLSRLVEGATGEVYRVYQDVIGTHPDSRLRVEIPYRISSGVDLLKHCEYAFREGIRSVSELNTAQQALIIAEIRKHVEPSTYIIVDGKPLLGLNKIREYLFKKLRK